ncbi:hypothetical protein [Mesorhizobium sp. B2-8-9]|uniref:hypothetical protein n=1 Tax=Mesorhizobium sp. B2-8-9 TaxID=2589899 RepID=UPI00112B48B1|nr:hypothetical protein [Mesorhizobium sp. B2-8-9]TPI86411.1 hypothetical protein FJ423_00890 [Mesorhizobium sp. B2-8-9]
MIKVLKNINWPALAALGFTVAFWWQVGKAAFADQSSPVYEFQATTGSGDLFVAGSGDSCAAARSGAVLPDDVRTLDCVQVR